MRYRLGFQVVFDTEICVASFSAFLLKEVVTLSFH